MVLKCKISLICKLTDRTFWTDGFINTEKIEAAYTRLDDNDKPVLNETSVFLSGTDAVIINMSIFELQEKCEKFSFNMNTGNGIN